MHHTLYIIVDAENGKEAMSIADAHIEDWGTENNWRTIIGAIARNGHKTYPTNDTSHHFSLKSTTLASINKYFQRTIRQPQPVWTRLKDMQEFVQKLVDGNFSGKTIRELVADKDKDRFWAFKEFAQEIFAVSRHSAYNDGEKFDVFKHTFRSGDYDEVSVTHADVPEDGTGKLFCVLVDMHT